MDDWYEISVAYILASRGLDRDAWDTAVEDYADLLADEALEMGFVDKLGDYHDMKENLDDIAMRETPDLTATTLGLLTGDMDWRWEQWGERERIALLYAIGSCSMDTGIKGRLLSKEIRKVREDGRVKAVVLRADSPGGDALPSDLVSRELKLTMEKKPVIVSQGFVAASGGYWISMHSDSILASPLTITGSIGVISGHLYDDGFGEKLGLSYDQVKKGSHADLGRGIGLPFLGTVPHRPYDQKELDRVEYGIKKLYNAFMEQVAEGRGMTVDEVAEIAQGRVWSGKTGLEIGLVDELGGLWMALDMAKEAAGIDPDHWVKVVEGPCKGKFDLGFLTPQLLGVDAEELAKLRDPLSGLSPRHRAYFEALQDAQGPQVLMEPFDVIDGATVY
jgi:protease-4